MPPRLFRFLINLYPPYLGTGIRVTSIAPDYRRIIVKMKSRFYNRNYVGTHFGGSLYAMVDPFYMLMLLNNLGNAYIVWDQAARLEFIKPGKGTVTAKFQIDQSLIDTIKAKTENGAKYLPELPVYVTDQNGDTVVTIIKTLYIRRKDAWKSTA